jgi:hypothetical protein
MSVVVEVLPRRQTGILRLGVRYGQRKNEPFTEEIGQEGRNWKVALSFKEV